jgi:hypothetical protein
VKKSGDIAGYHYESSRFNNAAGVSEKIRGHRGLPLRIEPLQPAAGVSPDFFQYRIYSP